MWSWFHRFFVRKQDSREEPPPHVGAEGAVAAPVIDESDHRLPLDELRGSWRRLERPIIADSSASVRNCRRLRRLPAGCVVGDTLTIEGCPRLEEIGGPLIVRSLIIRDSGIRRLPEGLQVSGNLTLQGCPQLEVLPEGLHVAGKLRITGCPRLRGIPSGTRVGHSLSILGRTKLERLPEGLRLAGDLVLRRSLASLPADLEVAGSLVLLHLRDLTELPPLHIGGDLFVRGCPRLTRLPDGLTVGGHLDMRFSALREVGAIRVAKALDLSGGRALETLPETLRLAHLWLADCASLRSLPQDLVLHGQGRWPSWSVLLLAGCESLRDWPRRLVLENGRAVIEVAGSGFEHGPPAHRDVLVWRGVRVTPELAFNPVSSFSARSVVDTTNVEQRRVLVERLGAERFIALLEPQVVDEDLDPGGPRRLLRLSFGDRRTEVYAFLDCRCPSTGHQYLLRVPPTVGTCHAAAAWLAGLPPDQYHPIQET